MTALSVAPRFGILTGPITSDPLTGFMEGGVSTPNPPNAPIPPGLNVNLHLMLSAGLLSADIAVMRSEDGGATWETIVTDAKKQRSVVDAPASPAYLAYMAKTYSFQEAVLGVQYQIVVSAPGTVLWVAFPGVVGTIGFPSIFTFPWSFGYNAMLTDTGGTVPAQMVGMPAAKFLTYYQARAMAPLGAADISGALTLYKRCKGGALATLSVPSGVARKLDVNQFGLGAYGGIRSVKANSATVTSLVDMQGNPVASDVSILDPTLTYAPGGTVTARDLYASGSTFSSGIWGISAWTTKLEAAAFGTMMFRMPSPNLAALGL